MSGSMHENIPQIRIGAEKDRELVRKIIDYKEQKRLPNNAEAVRELCKYALAVSNITY